MNQIAVSEKESLVFYEAIIERGLKTFIEVGNALSVIRDRELYLEKGYNSFELYCIERWGFEQQYARMIVNSARVANNIRDNCPELPLPENEFQVREIARLKCPQQQRVAWCTVVETAPNGKVTGNHVKQVVRSVASETSNMSVHWSSNTMEWRTPKEVIDLVLELMNTIDLDPCSIGADTINVPASQHFTLINSGLTRPWFGKIFMNPPYGREITEWVKYLCYQYECGNTTEAIALVPSRTDTGWFRCFKKYPRCFIWGRLRFNEHNNSAPFPSMLVYLGENIDGFVKVFSVIGDIYAVV